jgi:pyrimidine-nucleoside phosphorylase
MSQESPLHSPYSIIAKKRDGKALSDSEINFFIKGLSEGRVADYQVSALLMAIYLKGFSPAETRALTDAMLYSGEVVTFEGRHFIDKHSTGGVGDKASFILAPLASAAGVKVPMIAGRGLGHTGGTVDKIETVKGFNTAVSLAEFKRLVDHKGLALIGQTSEIAPADKKLYALRDVTATIESIPLITASIMSKKLAEGANGLVLDIKTGPGAFMGTLPKARALAHSLAITGQRFGKNMLTVISDMSEPLGLAIGNALEIEESIATLKGEGPKDLTELSLHLTGAMIYLAGLTKTHKSGIGAAQEVLDSGEGFKKFREMIANQGGDISQINSPEKLPKSDHTLVIKAPRKGYIGAIACKELGMHCVSLGGGRLKTSDPIAPGVGLVIAGKMGDAISKGATLATIHYNSGQEELVQQMAKSISKKDMPVVATKPRQKRKLIVESKTYWGRKRP